MPSVTPARRRRTVDSDDEENGDDISQGSPSPHGSKRARLERDAPSESPRTPLLPDSYRTSQRVGTDRNHAALKTHQPGSIVRVTLTNFVTYTAAEFFPGPSLNMVIGPNGTGKSTLVCAICLGLGWKTEHLGRAKEIGEFVKHGFKEADIEIELAADPARHRSNPVIRHHIKRDSKGSGTFFIDGRSSTKKAVAELCRSLSIQIDNLCQFLPQDRVVEFAALSAVDLLAQTQRAAAPEYMVEWHEELKTLRTEQKKGLEEQNQCAENLKNYEGRQNLQRADVERLKERADIQERVTALEKFRPVPAYRSARATFEEAKARRSVAVDDLERLKREVEPALRAVNAKQDYRSAIAEVVNQRKRIVKRSEELADVTFKKQEALDEKIKECQTRIDAEKEGTKKHKQERARWEAAIKELERLKAQAPIELDAAGYNEQLRELSRQMRELEDKASESNDRQRTASGRIESRNQRTSLARQDLDALRSQAGQQRNKLQSASRDTATAWEWIQKNPELFSGPVYGPPIVSCSVRDTRHANFIESVLSMADLLAFTVTCQQDFRTLQRELYDKQKLHDINIRNSNVDLSTYRSPIPASDLQSYGLDAFLLDLIEGPKEVLGMLCDNRLIHQTGVAFRDITIDQYDALTRSPISSFVTPKETYIITRRREYGDRGSSTRTQRLKTARFFSNQPVDSRAEQALHNQINELADEIKELKTEADSCKTASQELGIQHRALKNQKSELEGEKQAKQKALSEYNALPTKIANIQTKLDKVIMDQASYRQRVRQQANLSEQATIEKAQVALTYANAVVTLQRLHTELLEAEILEIEAVSDFETLEARSQEVRNTLQARQVEVQALRAEVDGLKKTAKTVLSQTQAMLAERTDREQEIHEEQRDGLTSEELENEIESMRARLEMVQEGDPRILREFEQRGARIEQTRETLEALGTKLDTLEGQITQTRERWEPELDKLIAEISQAFGENFARIGCAGQVEVYKDEDSFENWAIQVQVKFRENEQLSILDSHRQSGGERAVSTIFYLMALQSLARAPFRVVDEINQGMDPRNERLVHSRMVSIACAENTSQYFLITPKLLPNLTYHPNMKVHCIASGEYMPKDHRKLDFPALAQQAIDLRSRMNGVRG